MSPAAELALEVAKPLVGQIAEWLEGRAPEPPALKHLGVPEVTLTEMRQRAKAARLLGGKGAR